MGLPRRQSPSRLPTLPHLHLQGWLATLLLAAMPGALLICILHCTLSTQHHRHHSPEPSPFLCNQLLAAADDLPAVSATTVHGLVQGLGQLAAPVVSGLSFLYLAAIWAATLRVRLAEGPPAPPPRAPSPRLT